MLRRRGGFFPRLDSSFLLVEKKNPIARSPDTLFGFGGRGTLARERLPPAVWRGISWSMSWPHPSTRRCLLWEKYHIVLRNMLHASRRLNVATPNDHKTQGSSYSVAVNRSNDAERIEAKDILHQEPIIDPVGRSVGRSVGRQHSQSDRKIISTLQS